MFDTIVDDRVRNGLEDNKKTKSQIFHSEIKGNHPGLLDRKIYYDSFSQKAGRTATVLRMI